MVKKFYHYFLRGLCIYVKWNITLTFLWRRSLCSANGWIGFWLMGISVMKELNDKLNNLIDLMIISVNNYTAQKMKFSIQDFFSKCDQTHSFLRIWSHLLKKSLVENFIFCVVVPVKSLWGQYKTSGVLIRDVNWEHLPEISQSLTGS